MLARGVLARITPRAGTRGAGPLARGVECGSRGPRAPACEARSRRPRPAAPASAAARVRALSAQSRTHSPTTYDAMLPSDRRRAPSATRARAECSLASACSACLVPDACARRAHASCRARALPGSVVTLRSRSDGAGARRHVVVVVVAACRAAPHGAAPSSARSARWSRARRPTRAPGRRRSGGGGRRVSPTRRAASPVRRACCSAALSPATRSTTGQHCTLPPRRLT